MATSKSGGISNSTNNSHQTTRNKDDLPTLKNKVTELERQINEYKTKLDELRRAKATTVIKLEKEYVNTNLPRSNRTEKSKSCDKCEEYQQILDNQRKSNSQFKKILEEKETICKSSSNPSGPCQKCLELKEFIELEKKKIKQFTEELNVEKKEREEQRNHRQILERTLELTHSDLLQAKNLLEALRIENGDYQEALQTMTKEHQNKIDDLFQREEEAKKQVQTWEQMYRQWMATMERRVNHLQLNNQQLQNWLDDDNGLTPQRHPAGSNPNQRH